VLDKRREANGEVGFDFDSLWGDDEPQAVQKVPDRSLTSSEARRSWIEVDACLASGISSPASGWSET
jgi:hypothetical protein